MLTWRRSLALISLQPRQYSSTIAGNMPPKRPAKQVTPPPTKKLKRASKPAQPSIDSFFASPSKAKAKATPKKDEGIITIDDSDDEILPGSPLTQEKEDGRLARKLADEWSTGSSKGKKRDLTPEPIVEVEDDMEILPTPPRIGINGSSSSRKVLESPSSKDVKPVHPMFAGPNSTKKRGPSPTPIRDIKPDVSITRDVKPSVITSTSAEAVAAIDFDVDSFLFRPGQVDISNWPKGRLPYSVLVGVYVQVSSTRSRLTIVRVLTK